MKEFLGKAKPSNVAMEGGLILFGLAAHSAQLPAALLRDLKTSLKWIPLMY
jgi:hypothetical protein